LPEDEKLINNQTKILLIVYISDDQTKPNQMYNAQTALSSLCYRFTEP